jgi:hypothetical protein
MSLSERNFSPPQSKTKRTLIVSCCISWAAVLKVQRDALKKSGKIQLFGFGLLYLYLLLASGKYMEVMLAQKGKLKMYR